MRWAGTDRRHDAVNRTPDGRRVRRTVLAWSVIALTVAACGGSGPNDPNRANDGDTSGSQQDTHPRAASGYVEIRSEPLEVQRKLAIEDDILSAPYLHVHVSSLGTTETLRIDDEVQKPAKGETFYVARMELTPDPYDARAAKSSKDTELEMFPYIAAQSSGTEEQVSLESMRKSIIDGDAKPETYTIVAAGNKKRPPKIFVGDYNRIWSQALDLTRGKFDEDSVIAIEPTTADLSERYSDSATADLQTGSEATFTHLAKFDTARISSFTTHKDYDSAKNTVSVEATLQFDIEGFNGTQIAYYPEQSAKLVDGTGSSYPGVLLGSGSEHVLEFGKEQRAIFQFTVPRDLRRFTLDYSPDVTFVGADNPQFSSRQIPIDFGPG